MTGTEFVRKVRRLGRARDVPARFEADRGKGDHGLLWYGGRRTVVGDRGELKKGTLHGMPSALGLTLRDLQE